MTLCNLICIRSKSKRSNSGSCRQRRAHETTSREQRLSRPQRAARSPVTGNYLGQALYSFRPLQVGQDQLRQITAVTPFEDAEGRNPKTTNRLAEPIKVLRFQRLLGDRVTG